LTGIEKDILSYLADRQGEWTSLWMGHFPKTGQYEHAGQMQDAPSDVYWAMPKGTPEKAARSKMQSLYDRGLITGCICGCRGDFEITDVGLKSIGR